MVKKKERKEGGEEDGKGRSVAVITYHSLEDRVVKELLKSGNFEGKVERIFMVT